MEKAEKNASMAHPMSFLHHLPTDEESSILCFNGVAIEVSPKQTRPNYKMPAPAVSSTGITTSLGLRSSS